MVRTGGRDWGKGEGNEQEGPFFFQAWLTRNGFICIQVQGLVINYGEGGGGGLQNGKFAGPKPPTSIAKTSS